MRHPLLVVAALVVSSAGFACREQRATNASRPASNVAAQATPAPPPADAAATPFPNVENALTATMNDDERNRHRLFQAAATTRDNTLIREVGRRLGLFNPQNQPTADYRPFVEKHMEWARSDPDFIRDMKTPQKAREYVRRHK